MNQKVALITGGSRGIGFGIAELLANQGWNLAINGVRDEQSVSEIIKKLKTDQNEVIYCQGNIGNEGDRSKIINEVIAKFGQINVLVNNAGVAPKERTDLLEMSEESYDYVMDINLKGTFFLTQLASKLMVDAKQKDSSFEATIINISSISATVTSINRGQYCISKAGLSMVTQLFAARLGQNGISVYEIRPGIIQTDMTAAVKEKYDKLFDDGLGILPGWGYPRDVAKAVGALVRGDFPYTTGQVIMVDGGMTVQRL